MSGVDEEFVISSNTVGSDEICLSSHTSSNEPHLSHDDTVKDGTVGVAADDGEGRPSPSSSKIYFEGEDFGADGNEEDLVEKGHCYTPSNCLKEGNTT